MDYRSPLEDDVFRKVPRRPTGRAARARTVDCYARDGMLNPPPGDMNWSPRRLVLSTVWVNAVLWAATIFVVWWTITT